MRVLVVEDDSSVRETVGMVLEAFQHQPDLVVNGEQALDYLKTSWPDVMLLDLSLPGMSGEQVYERIQNQFGRVPPTVIVSALQQSEVRQKHLPGAWILPKPYTIEQLADVVFEAGSSRGAA